MAGYNRTRYVEELLEKTDSQPPSFTVHLHLEHWILNNGSKFLYNNQIAVRRHFIYALYTSDFFSQQSLLDDIRAHRIPVDFLDLFDAARVPFYDGSFSCHPLSGTNLPPIFATGCMVVELLDYRSLNLNEPPPEKPARTRVILHPNSESLWADICSLNQKYGSKWTDEEAVEIEAKLLVSFSFPRLGEPVDLNVSARNITSIVPRPGPAFDSYC